MLNKKLLKLSLLVCVVLTPLHSQAEVLEVSDEKLQQQIMDLDNLLGNQIYPGTVRQTEYLRKIQAVLQTSLTGQGGVGGSNNLAREQAFRNWTPTSADLANMVAQGLQTGSLADQIAYYNLRFKVPTAEQLAPGNASTPMADYGVFSAVSTNAALSIADKSFDNVPQIQEQIDFLYKQIDQQRNVKDSQDLNSVILLKIAALQADLMRIQSQQLKMQAVSHAEGNSKRIFMSQFVQDIK